jgi:hypothetical protein
MATKRPAKTLSPQAQHLLLQEASDPNTDPERLGELANLTPLQEASDPTTEPDRLHQLSRVKSSAVRRELLKGIEKNRSLWFTIGKNRASSVPLEKVTPAMDFEHLLEPSDLNDRAVRRAAWMNPSLPEDVWRYVFLAGYPEAWDNPMAPIYILTWTPREGDLTTVDEAARLATLSLWKDPERCSSEGKDLLAAKVQEWWATSESFEYMKKFLREWAMRKGNQSFEHLEVVRLLVQCARTSIFLTDDDRQALDLLEAWMAGGEDRLKDAKDLCDSYALIQLIYFAYDCQFDLSVWPKGVQNGRLLADVIRREMPMPPVVD